MKNINISLKLIICFDLIIALTLCVGIVSFTSINRVNSSNRDLFDNSFKAVELLGEIRENYQEQRVFIQKLLLTDSKSEQLQTIEDIELNKTEMDAYIAEYESYVVNEENAAEFKQFRTLYENYFVTSIDRILASLDTAGVNDAKKILVSDSTSKMTESINLCFTFNHVEAEKKTDHADDVYRSMITLMAIALALSIGAALFMSIYLPMTIARPLRRMVEVARAVAVGDMDVKYIRGGDDEIGKLSRTFEYMKDEMNKQVSVVEALSNADLTVVPVPRSEKDILGHSLVKLTDSLDKILSNVAAASTHIARESGNVAAESQDLAQGTTEQATAVEELSSAVFEISLNTKENAGLAGKAASMAENVKESAFMGEEHMTQMVEAVTNADSAGKNIDKIIKAIDDIAFQTNILALNAAVEAANAGGDGSGFAVVASEVRSLAAASASAAKETRSLISDVLRQIKLGHELAGKTSESFAQILMGIMDSGSLINDIAKSSEEQAIAIEQVNTGITQVAQVISLNSAAAEQCAASAEKMNDQAKILEDTVSKFKIKADDKTKKKKVKTSKAAAPAKPKIEIDLSADIVSDDFGKY